MQRVSIDAKKGNHSMRARVHLPSRLSYGETMAWVKNWVLHEMDNEEVSFNYRIDEVPDGK